MMFCCSHNCAKYNDCVWADINNLTYISDDVEPFDSFGSGVYSYNSQTGKEERKTTTMCENYSMFSDMNVNTLVDAIKKMEKQKMDNLDVNVKITPYIKDKDGRLALDFGKPVVIRSTDDDKVVSIMHDEHQILVSASELRKAIDICSYSRW